MLSASGFIFKWMSLLTSKKETFHILHDPTLYLIQTKTQQYTGKIAFQNDTLMKVMLAAGNERVVKILKENIQRVEILPNTHAIS